MINWIIGGIIVCLTGLAITHIIRKFRKGESCCCEGCSKTECSSRQNS